MGTKIGIGFSLSRGTLPDADAIYQFADRVEDLGIDSIWPSDHTVSLQPSLDVNCLLAAFAARTKHIRPVNKSRFLLERLFGSVRSIQFRSPICRC